MRGMTAIFGKTGAVVVLVTGLVACSSNSTTTPTAPSTSTGTTAAADGSTLKVSAPSGLLPASGTTVDSRRPTLSWSSASGTYVFANPAMYDLQVLVNGATIADIAVTGTTYAATTDLEPDTTYTWRVRARMDTNVGPWSATASFTTPKQLIPRSVYPLPFSSPGSCGLQPNQPTDRSACARDVAGQSTEWAACRTGNHVACFRFNRQVAQALAANDPRWGMISKNPGDTQCTLERCGQLGGEGYGEDVIAYLPTHDDTNRWIGFDIISGTGGPTPGIQWNPITQIRAGNRWVPVPY